MITVTVNGEKHEVSEGNLLDLIHHFGLKKEWTIAEINKKGVERSEYDTIQLNNDDIIELVRAVAGG